MSRGALAIALTLLCGCEAHWGTGVIAGGHVPSAAGARGDDESLRPLHERREALEAELHRLDGALLAQPDDELSLRRLKVVIALRDCDDALRAAESDPAGARVLGDGEPANGEAPPEENQKEGKKGKSDPLAALLDAAGARLERARREPLVARFKSLELDGGGGAFDRSPAAYDSSGGLAQTFGGESAGLGADGWAATPSAAGPGSPAPAEPPPPPFAFEPTQKADDGGGGPPHGGAPREDQPDALKAAVVKDSVLPPARLAELERLVQRAGSCVPAGAAHALITVRATLVGGRLSHSEVRSDMPLSPAVEACILGAVGRVRISTDGITGSRIIEVPVLAGH